ncbi:hypothetical protein ABZ814_19625 [Micromonospora musae]|uniref:hypothetical protein n=1 Tax=Micromonospora musae TaxID=1894970 RepID=UPI0033E8E647
MSDIRSPQAEPSRTPATTAIREVPHATPAGAGNRSGTRAVLVPLAATMAAVTALLIALRAGGALAVAIPGLPDPGPVTTWALPSIRLLGDALATLTVGTLVTAAFLLPGDGPSVSPYGWLLLRRAGLLAAGWAAATLTLIVLTVSDVLGVAPQRLSPAVSQITTRIPSIEVPRMACLLRGLWWVRCSGCTQPPRFANCAADRCQPRAVRLVPGGPVVRVRIGRPHRIGRGLYRIEDDLHAAGHGRRRTGLTALAEEEPCRSGPRPGTSTTPPMWPSRPVRWPTV